jgi:HK97 family phage major capsid protein
MKIDPHSLIQLIPYGADAQAEVKAALKHTLLTGPERHPVRLGLLDTAGFVKFRAALQSQSGPAGGYGVEPSTMSNALELALLDQSVMRRLATVTRAGGSADLLEPSTNDTSTEGELLAENAQVSDQDIVFGLLSLTLYKVGSKRVVIPMDLLQDAMRDFMPKLGIILGQRCGRLANRLFTMGTGASQPMGVVNAAPVGATAGSSTAIAADDVWSLYFSIDPAYRRNACFMASDAIYKVLRTLKDANGRYLFVEPTQPGYPPLLCGLPAYTNYHMPAAITSGQKTLLCGDFSKYHIRDGGDVTMLQWSEAPGLIDQYRRAFYLVLRTDGGLQDAGTGPIKALKHP